MNGPMDEQRFRQLLDAYGSRRQCWPVAEREAASLFAQTHDVSALTGRAAALDLLLDGIAPVQPSAALVGRILDEGQTELARNRRHRRWWWGVGLLAVGMAGGICGAFTVAVITPSATIYADNGATAFGLVQTDE
ncbi:hypothetical protein ACQ3G6_09730 [Allorhizobium undicola]|uniref:hypothetical protein n=1 Tax=Allorhizobium undicola TaxID=78527 RepID=UPI000685AAB4|nr:hypothetical protein [Allorhizobium undicola]